MRRLFAGFVTVFAVACGGGGGGTDGGTGADTTLVPDDAVSPPDEAADPAPGDPGPGDVQDPGPPPDVPQDLHFQDLMVDNTPPKVVKTEPANGATGVPVPFVIRVTFSEPIRFKETVDKNTFRVRDVDDKPVNGTYTYEEATNTVVFTPDAGAKMMLASPYRVALSTIIQDKAGNGLADWYYFAFSTALPPDMGTYEALAAKYAPVVYQATRKEAPHFDYLTTFDFDENWKALDNYEAIKKVTEVESFLYFDVVETKSHFFIRYGYFHPLHFGLLGGDAFGNELAGATVVVAKYPQERPIAVLTYFPAGDQEEVRSYVTEESGIVGGQPPPYYGVNWVFPEAQLFPGGHYLAYVTANTHESCLWIHTTKENFLDQRCQLTEGEKLGLSIVQYVYDGGVSDTLKKEGGSFPAAKQDVRYGLRLVLQDFWTRRDQTGTDTIYTLSFSYEAPEGRPGNGLELPSAFLDPVNPTSPYKGRPPWAWQWQATTYGDFYVYQFPRGTWFLDPAWFFMKRHRLNADWNWDTKEGYSPDYCFNPYLLIDQRQLDPACKPAGGS